MVPRIILVLLGKILIILVLGDTISLYYIKFGSARCVIILDRNFMVPRIILVLLGKILIILVLGDTISLCYVKFGNSRQDFDGTIFNFDSIRHVVI